MVPEIAEVATKPIKHDGWKSRKFIGCSVAFLLLVGLFSYMRLDERLSENGFLYGVLGATVVLLVGLGLLSVDRIMELVKLRMLGGKKE